MSTTARSTSGAPTIHGYIGRLRVAWQALGGDPDKFEIVIMQLVNLSEAGERVKMSKRAGTIATLDDLLDDIGVDAARWFLSSRSNDTTLDLDLELARKQSQDNPVYYVQYAHARIASILRKAGRSASRPRWRPTCARATERFHPSARALVKKLLELPGEVREAAERRAPHRLTVYATETAQDFSAFYRDCRVVGAAEEGGDEDVRIATCVMAKRVLAQSLDLLGVERPSRCSASLGKAGALARGRPAGDRHYDRVFVQQLGPRRHDRVVVLVPGTNGGSGGLARPADKGCRSRRAALCPQHRAHEGAGDTPREAARRPRPGANDFLKTVVPFLKRLAR